MHIELRKEVTFALKGFALCVLPSVLFYAISSFFIPAAIALWISMSVAVLLLTWFTVREIRK